MGTDTEGAHSIFADMICLIIFIRVVSMNLSEVSSLTINCFSQAVFCEMSLCSEEKSFLWSKKFRRSRIVLKTK